MRLKNFPDAFISGRTLITSSAHDVDSRAVCSLSFEEWRLEFALGRTVRHGLERAYGLRTGFEGLDSRPTSNHAALSRRDIRPQWRADSSRRDVRGSTLCVSTADRLGAISDAN